MKVLAKFYVFYLLILDIVILSLGITYLIIALTSKSNITEHNQLISFLQKNSFWGYLRYFITDKESLTSKLHDVFNFSINKNLILVFSSALNLIVCIFPLFSILTYLCYRKIFRFLYFQTNSFFINYFQKNKKTYKTTKKSLKDQKQSLKRSIFKSKLSEIKKTYKINKKIGKLNIKIDYWYQRRNAQRLNKISFKKIISYVI